MERLLPQGTFDRLFPFSFVVEKGGRISQVGRSLRKVSFVELEGRDFDDSFKVEQPAVGLSSFAPASLVDEFIRLSLGERRGFLLRGQVAPVGTDGAQYIFSLAPDIARMSSLEEFGLDFTDFSIAEPIVDQMIVSSLFRQARESIEALYRKLAWRDAGTQLLHTLAAQIFGLSDERAVYRATIEHVCDILKWEFGHVFVPRAEDRALASAKILRVPESPKFAELASISQEIIIKAGDGLIGRAAQSQGVMWVQDLKSDRRFLRREQLAAFERLTWIGLPIVCGGETVAVLEFFSERLFSHVESAQQLLELVRRQVEQQVARVRSIHREREQQAMLVASSKMATLGELAAGVAHEINNPVSAISITAELLRRMASSGAVSPEILAAQVSRIQKCLNHITTIVSNLQSFSRDPSRDPVTEHRVADLVSGVLNLCGAKFMSRRVELLISPIPPEWTSSCRAAQVSQVILNLLSNAFDAVSESERPWVRVDIAEEAERFVISVTDSGTGVPESIREKMMVPFFTTKPPGKGTGLGLGISRNIMQALGGDLSYKAEAPNTTFVVQLPKTCQ